MEKKELKKYITKQKQTAEYYNIEIKKYKNYLCINIYEIGLLKEIIFHKKNEYKRYYITTKRWTDRKLNPSDYFYSKFSPAPLNYRNKKYNTDEEKIKLLKQIETEENKINENNKRAKYKNEIEMLESIHKDIPKPNKKFINWIKKVQMKPFMLYNNKTKKAICTKCSNEINAKKFKQNEEIVCPNCKTKTILKPKNKYPKHNTKYLAYAESYKNELLVRYFEVIKINETNEYKITEYARDLINETTITSYFLAFYKTTNYYGYVEQKDIKPLPYWYNIPYRNYTTEAIFWNNCQKYLTGEYKYWFPKEKDQTEYYKNYINENIYGYIYRRMNYPVIENLIKENRTKIIDYIKKQNSYSNYDLKKNEKTIEKTLMIPKEYIPEIEKEYDNNILGQLQKVYKEFNKITPEMYDFIKTFKTSNKIVQIMKKGKIIKTKNYLLKKQKYQEEYTNHTINLYADYINMLEETKTQITKENRFPQNLKEAHDELTILINKQKIKTENEEYKKIKNKLKTKYPTKEINGLIIRIPKDVNEIIKEGINQNNCVKTYIKRVINNQSIILFARKKETAKNAYITIEVKPETKEIVQARIKNNIPCCEEDKNTIQKYLENLKAA